MTPPPPAGHGGAPQGGVQHIETGDGGGVVRAAPVHRGPDLQRLELGDIPGTARVVIFVPTAVSTHDSGVGVSIGFSVKLEVLHESEKIDLLASEVLQE